MTQARPKCPPHAGHCLHYQDEHTAKGGCQHLGPRGQACGCTWTSGPEQGASPFGTVGAFAAVPPRAEQVATAYTTPKETITMPTALWNIAGVASELNVTPQAASAWHRGPEKTPAPSFKVEHTNLELWTVDDIELWHQWVEAKEAEKKAAKAAKAAPKPEEMPKAGGVDMPAAEIDLGDDPDGDIEGDDTGRVPVAQPNGRGKSKTA